MRLVVLYLRSRGLPVAVLIVAAVSLAGAGAATWLVARPELGDTARLPVAVAAALAAAVILAGTLHSPASEIEAATPRHWPRWRAAHAAAAVLVAAALLAPTLPDTTYGAHVLLRNVSGLLGLALLTASYAGPRLAWTLPTGYVFTVYLAAGTGDTALRPVWAFFMQPADHATPTITALVLLTIGILTWALTTTRFVGAGPEQ